MSIWKKNLDLERLNAISKDTLIALLGIEYTKIGDDFIQATMPVDARTHQPYGFLHGGASVVLAETLGSIAANMCVDEKKYCVGLDINANHIRAMRAGNVTGKATPLHIGVTTQVWQIEISDERERLVCTSRITMAVMQHKKNEQ